ncbi:hypothetical protein [Marinicellulosiphila megalodicopiae]|uniref:hypothetical protein n=1 Tax=Marinicellulosiphila megalodicopiae TaxID=2724896 RepID=UPI003BAE5456
MKTTEEILLEKIKTIVYAAPENLAAEIKSAKDMIENGKFITRGPNTQELHEQIKKLIADPKKFAKLGGYWANNIFTFEHYKFDEKTLTDLLAKIEED